MVGGVAGAFNTCSQQSTRFPMPESLKVGDTGLVKNMSKKQKKIEKMC